MRCARIFAEPPSLPWPQNPVGSDVLAAQRIFCSFRDPDERCARGFAATALQRIEVEMGSAYPDQCIRCVFFRCVRRPLRSAACPRRSASSSQRLRRTPRARHKRLHCLSCLLRASNRHRIQIQVVDGREQGRMAGPYWPGMYTVNIVYTVNIAAARRMLHASLVGRDGMAVASRPASPEAMMCSVCSDGEGDAIAEAGERGRSRGRGRRQRRLGRGGSHAHGRRGGGRAAGACAAAAGTRGGECALAPADASQQAWELAHAADGEMVDPWDASCSARPHTNVCSHVHADVRLYVPYAHVHVHVHVCA